MEDILLQNSLGDAQADSVVQDVIRVYEKTFPGQIAGYYVEGSYSDSTHLATSDLDLVVVFCRPLAHKGERKNAEQLWTARNTGALEVDVTIVDEQQLQEGVRPPLKFGSRLVYGQDVCRNYPLVPLETWTRERMHAAYWLLVTVYQRSTPLQLPLDFPDPTDEFYGYVNRLVRLPDGKCVQCTRNLVRTTGWAATALLALQAGQYAGRKRDCAQFYRTYIGDEWASFLEELSTFCRDEWHYLIPTGSEARLYLCSLCERTLLFERHFLALYKTYLLEQLHSTDQPSLEHACWVQKLLPLDDKEVVGLLKNSSVQLKASPPF